MGDNKQWFKVYTSIIMDQDMMCMSMEDRGRWMTLGALTAHNGTSGVLSIKSTLLCHLLQLPDDVTVLHEKISHLPNVNCACNGNGKCTVTFNKWHKYQIDNSAERVAKYRQNVTVIEEKRKEEKRKEKKRSKYGEYKHILLTEDEYKKLKERFKDKADFWINKVDKGIEQKGYKYKNFYLTVIDWAERERKDEFI